MLKLFLYYIGILGLDVISIFMYSKLIKKSFKFNLLQALGIVIVSILQFIVNIFNISTILPFVTLIAFCILFKWIFDESIKKSIIYAIIIWSISLIIDIITMLVMNFCNISALSSEIVYFCKIISSVIMLVLLYILSELSLFRNFVNKLYQKVDKLKVNKFIAFGIILLFFAIDVLSFINMDDKIVVISVLIVGVISCILICEFISLNYQIIFLKETNEILEKSSDASYELISEYRVLKHNLEHQLLGLQSVSNKKTRELIKALIEEYNSKFYIKHDITSMP